MELLETELTYQGRILRQLKRQGQVALYQMESPYGYEVVVIRVEKGREKFGKFYPDHEIYPSSEQWGDYGWSYKVEDLAGAEKRFASLLPKWGANVMQGANKADLTASEGQSLTQTPTALL